ncbi:MAG: response regulator [Desulfobacteraceae bacterium]|jgi:DNA-binding NtrC family response regulator|nr:response regulator [Desulfobacteraceae bacterium]
MKILVVDDENIVLSSCRLVLEAENFEVLLAESVEQALNIIINELPAMLLIDVKMPAHDGMYLMEKVNEKWPGIPIIVMSGYPTNGTVKAVAELGAAAFIAKPFTPDELLETVKSVLQKEKNHEKKESPGN